MTPGPYLHLGGDEVAVLSHAQYAHFVERVYTPATDDWDPVTHFPRVREQAVLGVEAPLWTETVKNVTAATYLLLPRLPAIAELAWSPAAARGREEFRTRIAAHAPRWRLLGLNYDPSPQAAW
jgi:hexosaminidase